MPRPGVNQLLYHGVLGPNARWRREVVAYGREPRAAPPAEPSPRPSSRRCRAWADPMRRRFALDVLECPRCGGRMRLIATIDDPGVVSRILHHLRSGKSRAGRLFRLSSAVAITNGEESLLP